MKYSVLLLALVGLAAAGRSNHGSASLRALRAGSHAKVKVHSKATEGYGSPKCPCIGIDDIEGETTVKLEKGDVNYPADLGASCEAWDDETHPDCEKGADGWCADKWCYVDPCNCDIDVAPKPNTYMPKATYQGKEVYYSYATCGNKDNWSKDNNEKSCVGQSTEESCMKLDDCSWDGDQCMGGKITSICGKWGKESCRCIGIAEQEGTVEVELGEGKKMDYPADTGAECSTWDNSRHPSCSKSGKKPHWCKQEWCYVDPCECKLEVSPKTSSYLPDANYQGKPIYYSYATCGGKDSWTKKNHKAACVNQEDEAACGKLDKCAWTGKECLGKELVETCDMEEEKKEGKKEGGKKEKKEKKEKKGPLDDLDLESGAPALATSLLALLPAAVAALRF